MSNDDKTRIVRPIEQLQRSGPPPLPKENDDDPTRKIDRPQGQDVSFLPVQSADEGKTKLFRPSSRGAEGMTFNPLAPRSETQDASDDPVVGWLIIVKGPGRGNAVRLGYGWNSIGRDQSQRARLDYGDSQISRINHSKLLYDPRGRKFTLTLGEGTNPTYLRGEALLGPTELNSGDTLQIGETELRFLALCGPEFDWQDNT